MDSETGELAYRVVHFTDAQREQVRALECHVRGAYSSQGPAKLTQGEEHIARVFVANPDASTASHVYVENDAGEVSRSQLEPDIYVGIDQATTDAQFKEVMDDVADGYRYLQRWTDDDGGFCCRFVPEPRWASRGRPLPDWGPVVLVVSRRRSPSA